VGQGKKQLGFDMYITLGSLVSRFISFSIGYKCPFSTPNLEGNSARLKTFNFDQKWKIDNFNYFFFVKGTNLETKLLKIKHMSRS
jgi:hypothetical protein